MALRPSKDAVGLTAPESCGSANYRKPRTKFVALDLRAIVIPHRLWASRSVILHSKMLQKQPSSQLSLCCRRIYQNALALVLLQFSVVAISPSILRAQTSTTKQAPSGKAVRYVRDPITGRTYRQELVNVKVPTTTWESKAATQTVYEPVVTTKYATTQKVVYVPQQSYELQPYISGGWNPFKAPAYAYRYQAVTRWIPTLQNQTVPLTSQNYVAKQKTIYVAEPVTKDRIQQQIVTTEIPASSLPAGTAPGTLTPNVRYASQPAPRIRIPLLARQQLLGSQQTAAARPNLIAAAPQPVLSTPAATGLRPINDAASGFRSSTYTAPLRTASTNSSLSRDPLQSGMSATVLR